VFCTLASLEAKAFNLILDEFPEQRQLMQGKIQKILQESRERQKQREREKARREEERRIREEKRLMEKKMRERERLRERRRQVC
jgi:hypothetical protein